MKTLHAGPLVTVYESGFLRRIQCGDTEVLRMIYFALRDRNWNTMESRIENEKMLVHEDRFSVSYQCIHLCEERAVMTWNAFIEGSADGTITFEIRGTMLDDFRRNRAGFCVLHPLTTAGDHCLIVHPDGSETTETFPVDISPTNPFLDIASMRWQAGGIPYQVDFEGDIFETEDQRNWADASYKTFCTPLRIPFPVDMKRGQTVLQKITFRPLKKITESGARAQRISLTMAAGSISFPQFGVGASSEVSVLSGEAIANIRALRLGHYRVEVYPGRDTWVADFSAAYETAYALGLPLEVTLHLTEKYREQMEAFSILCQQNKVRMKRILVLSAGAMVTSQAVLEDIIVLKGIFPRVLVGAGTNYNFNELNKNRFDGANADFITLAADPQEHAIDDLTVLENVAALEHLIKSAKAIYGEDKPVQLSPLTLRKRFNPAATNPADFFIGETLKADPRQKDRFAAVWTFGAICALTRGGASSITFFQTAGNQGIMSPAGETYPVYDVLKRFAPYQGKEVAHIESTDPLAVEGILIDQKLLGLVNYSDEEKTVQWNAQHFVLPARDVKFVALDGTK